MPSVMYKIYHLLTRMAGPFLPLWLRYRLHKGKEEALRLQERLGHAGVSRPAGKLLWVHAASMGESASALPLITAFLARYSDWQVLITTVTVTSAALMAQKLPPRAMHQFAPLDHPAVLRRFLDHWRPDYTLWVESELWPHMVQMTKQTGCGMSLVNARMSERSFRRWRWALPLFSAMMSRFDAIFPQSEEDVARFHKLGSGNVEYLGNLKYDTPPLSASLVEVESLQALLAGRPHWLAASTHPGEERMVGEIHAALKAKHPGLLTLIVPRHAERGDEITAQLRSQGLRVSQRARQEALDPATDIYLADTMGELGVFYRLSNIAFIGGSLVPHGGQNLLEAARLGCAVLCGPHMQNFAALCAGMDAENALLHAVDKQDLLRQLDWLLKDTEAQQHLAEAALKAVQRQSGGTQVILERIGQFITTKPVLPSAVKGAAA